MWYKRNYGKEFVSKVIASLVEIVLLLKPLRFETRNPETTPSETPGTVGSPSLLTQYSQLASESEGENLATFSFSYSDKIVNKKNEFIKMLDEKDLTKIKFTNLFWLSNAQLYPNLSRVSLILMNIASNSAFVERFFSLTGIISNEKRRNMSAKLLITRSMLSSNITLLEQLNE